MINEKVNLKETVTVQLIKGNPDVENRKVFHIDVGDMNADDCKLVLNQIKARTRTSSTLDGCGMPSITMNREVFGINVKGEKNDNND